MYKIKISMKHKKYHKSRFLGLPISRKAQVWSVDLIIGLLVFVMVITIFFMLIMGNKDSKAKEYADKADIVADKFYQEGLVNAETGEFNRTRFLELAAEDYQGLKERLGIVGDFCLFVESNDNPSTIVYMVNSSGAGWTSIGSHDLNISNVQCGTQWPYP